MSPRRDASPADHAVLVVEDEELIRIDNCDRLEKAGLKVLEAADAEEAMALLDAHPEVRVLVTDVRMPGWMSGIDLARQAAKKWPELSILLTSAYYSAEEDALPENMTLFPKPFSPDALVREVKLRMRR
ncbi:MAG: response regulator [Pseudomonadota bacterium]|nr:response regulator [Pseudomonadota bacterium]